MSQPPPPLLSAPYSLPGLRPHSAQITSGRLPPSSARVYRPSSADKSTPAAVENLSLITGKSRRQFPALPVDLIQEVSAAGLLHGIDLPAPGGYRIALAVRQGSCVQPLPCWAEAQQFRLLRKQNQSARAVQQKVRKSLPAPRGAQVQAAKRVAPGGNQREHVAVLAVITVFQQLDPLGCGCGGIE